jgi:hypothetical protein
MSMAEPDWQPINTHSYIDRLEQVKVLLAQASVVLTAQESGRAAQLVELARRISEQDRGHQNG